MAQSLKIKLFIVALTMASGTSAYADASFQKLVVFLNKPENKGPYFQNILNPIPAAVFKVCPDTTIVNMQIGLLKPVTFNAAGLPVSGQWVEHVLLKSCKKVKLFNVHMQVDANGKPHGQVMFSGNTTADLDLQGQAMKSVVRASKSLIAPTCATEMVVDTLHLGFEGVAVNGAKSAPFRELWAVDACGKKVQVTLHFIPDAKGIAIVVKPEESRVIAP